MLVKWYDMYFFLLKNPYRRQLNIQEEAHSFFCRLSWDRQALPATHREERVRERKGKVGGHKYFTTCTTYFSVHNNHILHEIEAKKRYFVLENNIHLPLNSQMTNK